jgi:hypothetical protein
MTPSDGFRVGGHGDYLAALTRKYQPEINQLRAKLRRTRLRSKSTEIQTEIDRLELEWKKARDGAEEALF